MQTEFSSMHEGVFFIPKPVIRLRFLLVLILSRLQWLCVESIFISHKKYNKPTGRQEATNPVKKE